MSKKLSQLPTVQDIRGSIDLKEYDLIENSISISGTWLSIKNDLSGFCDGLAPILSSYFSLVRAPSGGLSMNTV
jgi:hypothetical protein